MKLRFLSIVPLLLLTSCGSETVLKNVAWQYNEEHSYYEVIDGKKNKYGEIEEITRTYKVAVERVYFVYTPYKCLNYNDIGNEVYNRYYVSANKLYVYNIL